MNISETVQLPTSLLPYIIYHFSKNEYTAYIPYKIPPNNPIMFDHCLGSISEISNYFGLSTDRTLYSPSYTYMYEKPPNNPIIFEIGILGRNLNKIYKTIESIQSKLIEKNCEVNTNLKKINIKLLNII